MSVTTVFAGLRTDIGAFPRRHSAPGASRNAAAVPKTPDPARSHKSAFSLAARAATGEPPQADAYTDTFRVWLKADAGRNKRERRSKTQTWQDLRAQGYAG